MYYLPLILVALIPSIFFMIFDVLVGIIIFIILLALVILNDKYLFF